MAVKVPDEAKVYTSTYENFKGVDMTNDASNAYMRRSPDGLNMLPDIDGRPYKRTGWEIKLTASEFISAASSQATTVSPIKTMYFTLGGYDHLAIFNSLGMFIYKDGTLSFINTYRNEGEITDNAFPPSETIDNETVTYDPDPKRSFFFEGQGVAGFYVYCGLYLFRYDADGHLYKVVPYVPTILDGCSPTTGAGTIGESVNLLTRKRKITYFGDGSTTKYVLPSIADSTDPVVYIIDADTGEPEQTTDFTVAEDRSYITFTTAPYSSNSANVIIEYISLQETTVESVEDESTAIMRKTYYEIQKYSDDTLVDTTTKVVGRDVVTTANFNILSPNTGTTLQAYYTIDSSLAWGDIPDGTLNVVDDAYGTVTVTANTESAEGYHAGHEIYSSTYTDVVISSTGSYSISSPTVVVSCGGGEANAATVYFQNGFDYFRDYFGLENGYTYKIYCYADDFEYQLKMSYTYYPQSPARTAFIQCKKAMVYGSGLYNQVFFSTSTAQDYNTRVWYSAATDPSYMPDTNYMEVGATDIPVAGMMKCGEYLGIIKQNDNMDSSIYLAYATSFDETTTYAVKESIGGVGAVSNGAFNILNGEPLYLSKNGVMGIETSDTFRIRSRSHYINKALKKEPNKSSAISFVHNGLYYLCLPNGHCYVLDGSQKSSWANEKTNLQYECYYLENIPAHCFARYDDDLWFEDFNGNLCRFKNRDDSYPYADDRNSSDVAYTFSHAPTESAIQDPDTGEQINASYYILLSGSAAWDLTVGDKVRAIDIDYMVTRIIQPSESVKYVLVRRGAAIPARWATIADDDGAVHYFKNLQKKGCVVSLLPGFSTGVTVYLKADEKSPVEIGTAQASADNTLPFEFYVKKKMKKYKRLQIICENENIDEGFGIDQIIKSYKLGNYSKG